MGMANPPSFDAKPWKEHFKEGEPFYLVAAKVVKTGSTEYDDDRMVVLTIRQDTEEKEYTIWGKYLVAQVESAEKGDFGKPWKIVTTDLPNSDRRGKVLVPADEEVPF